MEKTGDNGTQLKPTPGGDWGIGMIMSRRSAYPPGLLFLAAMLGQAWARGWVNDSPSRVSTSLVAVARGEHSLAVS